MHRMPVACGAGCEPGHGPMRVLSFDSPSGRRDQMTAFIGRREFITLLGGAAARGRSRRARSRPSGCGASACSCPQPRTIRNFRPASRRSCRGWQQLGWTIGRNVRIDTRWATSQCRRHSQTRGGIGRARAGRHPGPWRLDRGAVAAGDPHRADRVPGRRRSGRRRLRRQPGAAGRQRHRFHDCSNTA